MKRFVNWLNTEIQLSEADCEIQPNNGKIKRGEAAFDSISNGRPKKRVHRSERRIKRRKTEAERKEYNTEALTVATELKLKNGGNVNTYMYT